MKNFIISVDGPAGSGKERIAKYIAKKYGLFHLDSGMLYRRFSLLCLNNKINIKDKSELAKIIKSQKQLSSKKHKSLRSENISLISSLIAKHVIVRNFVNSQQKIIVKEKLLKFKGCVVDGRDIGSKVFTNAKIKLFIEVNSEIRAKRRHKQLIALGEKSIYAQILKKIKMRDKLDMTRKASPLIIPNDAIVIDNSKSFNHTTIEINKILKKI